MTSLEAVMRSILIPYVGSMPMEKFEALVQAVTLAAIQHATPNPDTWVLRGDPLAERPADDYRRHVRDSYVLGEGE